MPSAVIVEVPTEALIGLLGSYAAGGVDIDVRYQQGGDTSQHRIAYAIQLCDSDPLRRIIELLGRN